MEKAQLNINHNKKVKPGYKLSILTLFSSVCACVRVNVNSNNMVPMKNTKQLAKKPTLLYCYFMHYFSFLTLVI